MTTWRLWWYVEGSYLQVALERWCGDVMDVEMGEGVSVLF